MKRIFTIIFSLLLTVAAFSQAKITTRKVKFSDFTYKTTKVVMTGNEFIDQIIRNAVKNSWNLSPYEFCSHEEYLALRKSEDYYFLVAQKRKEPGTEAELISLSLLKGTPSDLKMIEVVSIPFCSAKMPTGREAVFAPALLDIMQDFVSKAVGSDLVAYSGLSSFASNISRIGKRRIVFSKDDLAPQIGEQVINRYFDSHMEIVESNEADEIFMNGERNDLVSFTVAPSTLEVGGVCYKMLIDARSHELFYFKKDKIRRSTAAGFLKSDIKRLSAGRRRLK